jgi:hypothetical protein
MHAVQEMGRLSRLRSFKGPIMIIIIQAFILTRWFYSIAVVVVQLRLGLNLHSVTNIKHKRYDIL